MDSLYQDASVKHGAGAHVAGRLGRRAALQRRLRAGGRAGRRHGHAVPGVRRALDHRPLWVVPDARAHHTEGALLPGLLGRDHRVRARIGRLGVLLGALFVQDALRSGLLPALGAAAAGAGAAAELLGRRLPETPNAATPAMGALAGRQTPDAQDSSMKTQGA